MKCIDAIEGTIKRIIEAFLQNFLKCRQDDTEYILNVKTIIESTDRFVNENIEIVSDPKVLKEVLYHFAKELWRKEIIEMRLCSKVPECPDRERAIDPDYDDYYYDYIYANGVYPP